MKKSNYIFILIVLIFNNVCLAKKNKPNKKENSLVQLDRTLNTTNSLLWQVSGNGLQAASYLFGTIHEIEQSDFFLGKNLEKKIRNSKSIIMEIDINNLDVLELAQLSLLPENKSIKNYLNDSDLMVIENFAIDSIGLTKQIFNDVYAKLKPFFLEQLIITNLIKEKISYEMEIKKIADEKNTTIIGLETMNEQLKFIDEIPINDQLLSIVKTIKNFTNESTKLNELIQYYKAQNIEALSKMFEEEELDLKLKLVDKRNNNWIPKLVDLFSKKSCFVAVGAGHLAGENGLINLLKKQGYTVEPISIN